MDIRNTSLDGISVKLQYINLIRLRFLFLVLLFIALVILGLAAIKMGSFEMSWSTLLRGLLFDAQPEEIVVIWQLRLPRICAAITSGIALGLSGLISQTLLGNPLASPSTLGISQGAAFGACFSLIIVSAMGFEKMWPEFLALKWYLTSILAFIGGMMVVTIIWALQKWDRMNPNSIILAGVAISSLFVSATILLQYFADETAVVAALFWTFGDVARSTWSEIAVLFVVVLLSVVYALFRSQYFNAACGGDDAALNLGVDIDRFRLAGLAIAALIASLTTCFHGVIAFLGLLAPHIAKRIVGGNHLFLFPATALIGALLLISADLLGRTLIGSGTLPVGIITSLLGAPWFLYLLLSRKKNANCQ